VNTRDTVESLHSLVDFFGDSMWLSWQRRMLVQKICIQYGSLGLCKLGVVFLVKDFGV